MNKKYPCRHSFYDNTKPCYAGDSGLVKYSNRTYIYLEAILWFLLQAVERLMLKKSPGGLVYIGNYKNGRIEPGMEHLVRLHVILRICYKTIMSCVHALLTRAASMYISLCILQACFSGGMYALASKHIADKEEKDRTLKIGADLTSTCHESYARSGVSETLVN